MCPPDESPSENDRRPIQFNLWQLLGLVTILGVTLGIVRAVGSIAVFLLFDLGFTASCFHKWRRRSLRPDATFWQQSSAPDCLLVAAVLALILGFVLFVMLLADLRPATDPPAGRARLPHCPAPRWRRRNVAPLPCPLGQSRATIWARCD